ncbi:MAG: addiction module protein [Leptolyngbyaceae cyanobacterium]
MLILSKVGIAERIQLAEDLWDSILAQPEALPLTDEQKQELEHRLEEYRQIPEVGSS